MPGMTSSSRPRSHLEELGNALGTASRPSTLSADLTAAVSTARELFDAAACSCALVDDDGATLRFAAAAGAGAEAIVGVTLPVSRGIAGWAAMSGQPIAVADVSTDSRFALDVAEATDYVPTSVMAAPMVARDGQVLGVLEVLDGGVRGADTGVELNVLGALASQLATIAQLGARFDTLGSSLVQTMARAAGEEKDADTSSLLDPATGVDLSGLAEAFHQIALGGPDAAQLAERVLASVADFVRPRR